VVYKQQKFASQSLEGCKSKIRVLAWLILLRALFQAADFLHFAWQKEFEGALSTASFYNGTYPIHEGSTHKDLITCQRLQLYYHIGNLCMWRHKHCPLPTHTHSAFLLVVQKSFPFFSGIEELFLTEEILLTPFFAYINSSVQTNYINYLLLHNILSSKLSDLKQTFIIYRFCGSGVWEQLS
jgi:hypothetical protein